MNAQKALNQDDRQIVEQKVKELEEQTSAEIVCAVATESGRYDRAEAIVGIVTAVAALGFANWACHFFVHVGDWRTEGAGLLVQVAAVVSGFVAGNYLAAFYFPLRRAIVPRSQLTLETQKAAAHVFCSHSLGQTKKRSGVLVYVSLFEHRIVILPDQNCREALTDELITEICNNTAAMLKTGSVCEAVVHAIDQMMAPLAQALPSERKLSENELPDHVLVFHR